MTRQDDPLIIEVRQRPAAGGYSLLDSDVPNIANYHGVVVDAVDINELFVDPDSDTARAAMDCLLSMTSKLTEVVSHGATVVIILPPPGVRYLSCLREGKRQRVPINALMGGPFTYTADPGLRVSTVQESARRYFSGLKNVDGIVTSSNPTLPSTMLAEGEYAQSLAIQIRADSGTYTYLPPYRGSPAEAIDIVAEDILGTPRQRTPWPDWISQVHFAPVQQAATRLEHAQDQVTEAERQLQEASTEFENAREPLTIVVESGLRLQEACEDIFRSIGITTEPVRLDVSDEFMLQGGAKAILVEVKGLEGPAKKADLTQLITDAANWEEREKREVKPLLLVNSHRLLPLQERETIESRPFTQWVEENTPVLGTALMTTWDLLEVYYAASSNTKLADELLQAIVNTNGRVDVRKLLSAPNSTTSTD